MLTEVFLEKLQDILQRDNPVSADTLLLEMEEWDSLAVMSCMAWFDKNFALKTKFSQYKQLRTVSDLIALAGGHIQ